MFDQKKMKKMGEEIAARGGNNLFLNTSKLPFGETHIRVLPGLPIMEGAYFVEQQIVWVGGKSYLSNKTFGKDCVFDEEIKKAEGSKDKAVIALLNDKKKLSRKTQFLIPVLLLDVKFEGDTFDVESLNVTGHRVLQTGPSLMAEINKVLTSRAVQNKTEDGPTDRVEGVNIVITKTKTGASAIDVEYDASAWPFPYEMEEKWYDQESKDFPNVIKITKDARKSDEYNRSVIRNYLYGEELAVDENAAADEKKEETTKTATDKPQQQKRGETANRRPIANKQQTAAAADEKKEEKVTRPGAEKKASGVLGALSDLDD